MGYPGGVVMACDSGSTDSDDQSKVLVDKIHRVGTLPILVAGTGSVSVIQNCINGLQEQLKTKEAFRRYRPEIKKIVVPAMKDAVASHVQLPTQQHHLPPSCGLLVAGVSEGNPWILEIAPNGEDTQYGNEYGNFYAVGSGKASAHAFVHGHRFRERDANFARILAYRVVADSIELAATHLSFPIYMHEVRKDGSVITIDSMEMERLAEIRKAWRLAESDAVGKILAPADVDYSEVPTPP